MLCALVGTILRSPSVTIIYINILSYCLFEFAFSITRVYIVLVVFIVHTSTTAGRPQLLVGALLLLYVPFFFFFAFVRLSYSVNKKYHNIS